MAPKHLAQPAKVIECDDDRQCRICWGEEEMSLTRSTVDGMLVAPCSCAGGSNALGLCQLSAVNDCSTLNQPSVSLSSL